MDLSILYIILIIQAIVFATACSYLAEQKGKDATTWAIIGFFLGVIGLLLIGFSKDESSDQENSSKVVMYEKNEEQREEQEKRELEGIEPLKNKKTGTQKFLIAAAATVAIAAVIIMLLTLKMSMQANNTVNTVNTVNTDNVPSVSNEAAVEEIDIEVFIDDVIETIAASEDPFADIDAGKFLANYKDRTMTSVQREVFNSVILIDNYNNQLQKETDVEKTTTILEMITSEIESIIVNIDVMRGE